jgi:4-amino-4-deoxy-L-arabinose transferase-like glycosyltransferase
MDRDDSLGGGFTLTVILLGTLVARCVGAGQPIVENYVGRQIPTAMVARNLDRGTGFLQPRLDVGPSPNLFLVEPPVYQTIVVGLRRVSGLPLEASGRIVSAFGIVLGGLGLYRIVARRSGARVALLTVALFGLWPITIRYGRAFQPDALMRGSVVVPRQ